MGRCSWKPLGMLWFDVNWCDVRRVHLGKPFLGAALSLEAASSVEAGTPLEIVCLLGAMVSQVLFGVGGICFVAGRRVAFFFYIWRCLGQYVCCRGRHESARDPVGEYF